MADVDVSLKDGVGGPIDASWWSDGLGKLIPYNILKTQAGVVAANNPLRVAQPPPIAVSASFTRPADTTAYAAGDLIANSTTAGSVVPLSFAGAALASGGTGRIEKVTVLSGNAVTGTLRVHYFAATPTMSVGDNGALSFSSLPAYVGCVDVQMDSSILSSGRVGVALPALDYLISSGTTLYAVIETLTAFTPTNAASIEVRTLLRPLS